jgi:hypothetical protein
MIGNGKCRRRGKFVSVLFPEALFVGKKCESDRQDKGWRGRLKDRQMSLSETIIVRSGSIHQLKDKIAIMSLHFAIFFALVIAYAYYIVPIFGYEGYVFEASKEKLIATLGLCLILSLITPKDDRKPSTLFLQIALVFVLLPMLVLFYAADKPWMYTLEAVAAYALVAVMVSVIKIRPARLPYIGNNNLLNILLGVSAVFIVSVFAFGGASYLNFDIEKVYDFRSDAAENLPGIFGYISPWAGKVVLPLSLLLSVSSRRHLSAIFCVGSSVLVFGLTAHKGPLFYPFVVLLVYMLLSSKEFVKKFCLATFCLITLSILALWVFQIHEIDTLLFIGSLILRRAFFVPASLNYIYYDFFSINPWVLWSSSKFTFGMIENPYRLTTSHVIGYEYFHQENMGANTGWLGSGYMQAGFLGILLYAVIIWGIFSFVDGLAAKHRDRKLLTAGLLIPVISLITSSDLPTAFLTHGLLLNLVLISLVKHRKMATESSIAPLQLVCRDTL